MADDGGFAKIRRIFAAILLTIITKQNMRHVRSEPSLSFSTAFRVMSDFRVYKTTRLWGHPMNFCKLLETRKNVSFKLNS